MLPALDQADVVSMQVRSFGERFLRKPALKPPFPYYRTDSGFEVAPACHGRSVTEACSMLYTKYCSVTTTRCR